MQVPRTHVYLGCNPSTPTATSEAEMGGSTEAQKADWSKQG